MIGFVMTINLSQLKIVQLRSKNKRTLIKVSLLNILNTYSYQSVTFRIRHQLEFCDLGSETSQSEFQIMNNLFVSYHTTKQVYFLFLLFEFFPPEFCSKTCHTADNENYSGNNAHSFVIVTFQYETS